MYKLIAYKYGRIYGTKTGKEKVLSMLIQEIGKPSNVVYRKKTVAVYYHDDKFTEKYILPIEYWEGKEGIEK